jgi:PAS domain S-box-containing protein
MAKKLKEQIKALEEKHRAISGSLIDAIWVLNVATLKYDYVSPSIDKISGFAADEYKNKTIYDKLTPESSKKFKAMLQEEIAKFEKGFKGILKTQLQSTHKAGHLYWIEVRSRLIKEAEEPLKLIGVTREISDRKKVEVQQNELIKKLNDTLAEKDKLLEENNMLRGLFPTCSGCKRIRDEDGKWWPFDAYLTYKSKVKLSHTICKDCSEVFYPDL